MKTLRHHNWSSVRNPTLKARGTITYNRQRRREIHNIQPTEKKRKPQHTTDSEEKEIDSQLAFSYRSNLNKNVYLPKYRVYKYRQEIDKE